MTEKDKSLNEEVTNPFKPIVESGRPAKGWFGIVLTAMGGRTSDWETTTESTDTPLKPRPEKKYKWRGTSIKF